MVLPSPQKKGHLRDSSRSSRFASHRIASRHIAPESVPFRVPMEILAAIRSTCCWCVWPELLSFGALRESRPWIYSRNPGVGM
eukprot:1794694-Rhodomonas_salina.2